MSQFQFGNFENRGGVSIFHKCPNFNYLMVYFAILPLVSRENKENLKRIHKYCKREIKLKTFKNNISAISVLGSYYIFNNRNIESWHTPSNYIYAPMTNM